MLHLKDWNMKHLLDSVVLGIVLVLVITLVHLIVSPLLVTILPMVFKTGLSLTEILLLLVLIRLHTK